MTAMIHFWIETAAFAAAIILIPLYMGYVHMSPPGAVAYAAVGGLAMAVGEALQFDSRRIRLTVWEVGLWCGAILGTGGIVYILALLLI